MLDAVHIGAERVVAGGCVELRDAPLDDDALALVSVGILRDDLPFAPLPPHRVETAGCRVPQNESIIEFS
jgi:hypothetical protein